MSVQATVPESEWQYNTLLDRTNCTTGKLACLRNLTSTQLQVANLPLAFPGRNGTATAAWSPCVCDNLDSIILFGV